MSYEANITLPDPIPTTSSTSASSLSSVSITGKVHCTLHEGTLIIRSIQPQPTYPPLGSNAVPQLPTPIGSNSALQHLTVKELTRINLLEGKYTSARLESPTLVVCDRFPNPSLTPGPSGAGIPSITKKTGLKRFLGSTSISTLGSIPASLSDPNQSTDENLYPTKSSLRTRRILRKSISTTQGFPRSSSVANISLITTENGNGDTPVLPILSSGSGSSASPSPNTTTSLSSIYPPSIKFHASSPQEAQIWINVLNSVLSNHTPLSSPIPLAAGFTFPSFPSSLGIFSSSSSNSTSNSNGAADSIGGTSGNNERTQTRGRPSSSRRPSWLDRPPPSPRNYTQEFDPLSPLTPIRRVSPAGPLTPNFASFGCLGQDGSKSAEDGGGDFEEREPLTPKALLINMNGSNGTSNSGSVSTSMSMSGISGFGSGRDMGVDEEGRLTDSSTTSSSIASNGKKRLFGLGILSKRRRDDLGSTSHSIHSPRASEKVISNICNPGLRFVSGSDIISSVTHERTDETNPESETHYTRSTNTNSVANSSTSHNSNSAKSDASSDVAHEGRLSFSLSLSSLSRTNSNTGSPSIGLGLVGGGKGRIRRSSSSNSSINQRASSRIPTTPDPDSSNPSTSRRDRDRGRDREKENDPFHFSLTRQRSSSFHSNTGPGLGLNTNPNIRSNGREGEGEGFQTVFARILAPSAPVSLDLNLYSMSLPPSPNPNTSSNLPSNSNPTFNHPKSSSHSYSLDSDFTVNPPSIPSFTPTPTPSFKTSRSLNHNSNSNLRKPSVPPVMGLSPPPRIRPGQKTRTERFHELAREQEQERASGSGVGYVYEEGSGNGNSTSGLTCSVSESSRIYPLPPLTTTTDNSNNPMRGRPLSPLGKTELCLEEMVSSPTSMSCIDSVANDTRGNREN